MPSITNLIRGSGREYLDLFAQAGANVARAGELLDEMLGGFPESQGLAQDILVCERDGDQITHELINRLKQDVRNAHRSAGHSRSRIGA